MTRSQVANVFYIMIGDANEFNENFSLNPIETTKAYLRYITAPRHMTVRYRVVLIICIRITAHHNRDFFI